MTSPRSTPTLSCLVSAKAPIVAVVARLPGRPRWTCILKWDLNRRTLEQGAWTKMRIKTRSCRISADGEFWMYAAEGPIGGPFSAYYGGGLAIARLPWLAALTDIEPFAVAGGGPSRDALPKEQQVKLWDRFKGVPRWASEDTWPGQIGPAWKKVHSREYGPERLSGGARRTRLAAVTPIPRSRLRLVLIADRYSRISYKNELQRFFLESIDDPAAPLALLPGVCWAHLLRDGRIIVATDDGRLRRLRPKHPDNPSTRFRIEEEHDLRKLLPRPAAAPRHARSAASRS
jgi:hypothetical protein